MDDRFIEQLQRYHERLCAGDETPPDDWDGPLGQQLGEAGDCLRLIERVRRQDRAEAPCTTVEFATQGPLPAADWRIGRFQIIKELGRGGHGIVFLAWDPVARRQVALKTPHPDVLFTPPMRERFLREGIVAAGLSHPNIIAVLEVDHSGPVCFIVSSYCAGTSLAEFIAEQTDAAPARLAAEWVAQLADGVEHAHCHGILHRDLKPANVVLEAAQVGLSPENRAPAEGSLLIPRLTDFGLAKLLEPTAMRTRTGALLGTPAYMAPEQVDARIGAQGPATDVYGLGVILYELLTGRPPFVGNSDAEVIRQIAAAEPAPPGGLRPDLSRDLEAICLKCLERRPQARFSSSAALAVDLRRFLAGEVTYARPVGVSGHALRWARRRPATAIAVFVSAAAALLLAGGAAWHFVRLASVLEVAQEARMRAEQGERELGQLLFYRDVQEAHAALQSQDVSKAGHILSRPRPSAAADERGFTWRYLLGRCFGQPVRLDAHRGHAHSASFSPDGKKLVTAGADGVVVLWDVATGRRQALLRGGAREVNFACFSPDGRAIASAESGGKVRLWDVDQGRASSSWQTSELRVVNCVCWSPDGRHVVASGSPGNVLMFWDVATGQPRRVTLAHTDEVNHLAYSPDGKRIATASTDGTLIILDVESAQVVQRIDAGQSHLNCVQFSPDGAFLATCGARGTVKIWSALDGRLVATCETNAERIGAVAFAPEQTVVAFGDDLGHIRQWDWKNNRIIRVVDGRRGRIMSVIYAKATGLLATAATDGSACLWDLKGDRPDDEVVLDHPLVAAAFTADSRRLVWATSESRRFDVFDTRDRSVRSHASDSDAVDFARFVPAGSDGTLAFLTTRHDAVFRLDLDNVPVPIIAGRYLYASILVTPDGRTLVTGDDANPHLIRLWDCRTGKPLATLSAHDAPVLALACTKSGDLLATASVETVRLWNLRQRKLLRTFNVPKDGVYDLDFSADGSVLASAGQAGRVRSWNTRTGEPSSFILHHRRPVKQLAFCPDEPIIATGDNDGLVRFWTLSNGEQLFTLEQLPGAIVFLRFSPDGRQFCAGCYAKSDAPQIRIWHAPL